MLKLFLNNMITSLIDQIIGTKSQRFIKKHQKLLQEINALETEFALLTKEEIREKINIIRKQLKENKINDLICLPIVFALVRETAKRTIGHRHFDVQMIAGIALYLGYIAEMQTGEGKTLAATTTAVLRALQSQVHIITVNDYLAERDGKAMGKIYEYLGLSTGYIIDKTPHEEAVYLISTSDILHVRNDLIVFKYLKYLMRMSPITSYQNQKQIIQFNQYCAIIDEVDNALIDEARTPFIISTESNKNTAMLCKIINSIIITLQPEVHYNVIFKNHNVFLTDAGVEFLENVFKKEHLIKEDHNLYYSEYNHLVHIINNSLRAQHIFRKDIEYTVLGNKIVIIDEHTGRLSIGRNFSKGLHQALEAKENVEVQDESQTLLSITYTSFFKDYTYLCGMTGTASTEKEEFLETYALEIIKIPTHRQRMRIDNPIRLYKNRQLQLEGLVELIQQKNKIGQPLLIVTTNVQESEIIAYMLNKERILYHLLNAKNPKEEAACIAKAGEKYNITVATNMAGRGTDITLGGNIEFQVNQMLLLSKDENQETAEDNDEKKIEEQDELGDLKFEETNLTSSQKKKIKNILEDYKPLKQEIIDLGGLCVITFGMTESEKIWLQAIGRAGRQGDPGESFAFYSIEDDIFATSLQDSWNRYLFSKIFNDDEAYISGGPVLSTIRKLWNVINAKHFRSRKELNKYENIRSQQRKDFFNYREIVLLATDMKAIFIKCFDVFYKDDFSTYTKEFLIINLSFNFEDKKEIQENFYKYLQEAIDDKDNLQYIALNILDEIWKEQIQEVESIQYGSGLVAYAQKDPFHEFSVQVYNAFFNSIKRYRLKLLEYLFTRKNEVLHQEQEISEKNFDVSLRRLIGLISDLKKKK
jgi:preprotein translocase subunit SecA